MDEKPAAQGSLEEVEAREQQWLREVYKGGREPEVTFRSVLLGAVIGALLCLSNVYVGFKTGWSLGVTITAAIMAFAVFKTLKTILPFLIKTDMGMLETNALLTMASACAFIASAGLSNAVPALLMVSGRTLPTWQLCLWVMVILYLGLCMAIPMKRQMINAENLRFPTGYATSEVLKGIYAEGGDAIKKARALFSALGIGLLIAWCRDGAIGLPVFKQWQVVKEMGVWQWKRWLPSIPATWVPASWAIMGLPMVRLTLCFEGSLIMVGAGAIMGIRAGASLLLGALIGYGVLTPIYLQKGDVRHEAPRVRAAQGFDDSPQVYSGVDLFFPVSVEAGQTLAFSVEEAGQPPRLMARTWTARSEYRRSADLLSDLNAAKLRDGSANPFAGALSFQVDGARNRLFVRCAARPERETRLDVTEGTKEPALGFKPGESDRVLRFPLEIPAGTSVAYTLGHMTGPRTDMVRETLAFTWTQGASYPDGDSLVKALNADQLPDGAPNPLAGKITFALDRGHLTATAGTLRHWDSELAVATEGQGGVGFLPGQSRRENWGGFRNIVRWLMWPGVAMMVTAGLLSFFMQWRTVVRAFAGLIAMFRRGKVSGKDPLAAVEVPGSWFAMGTIVAGLAAVVLQVSFFGIAWWMGILAVVMSFFLAIVACRATGETDITPVGAMGKITQLMYGGIAPGNMVANLMTANVTAGAATSSADLLQAWRCGFMVGASPRKQFAAMLLGVAVGALVSAPVYNILVPSADVLGTDKLPAPAAQTWAGVALLLSAGLKALPLSARWGLLWGGLFGIIMTLLERIFPKARKYMPSPTAMGIAFVIPAFNSVSMFIGALIAWIIEKRAPKFSDQYTMSVASGLIAGESLMGIAVAMLIAFQFMG